MARRSPRRLPQPTRLAADLNQRYERVLREIDTVLRRAEPLPSDLHRLHRELRELRAGVGVWAELLPQRQRPRLDSLARWIRRTARAVGQVRDRDVALRLTGEVRGRVRSPASRERLDRYRDRLRAEAREARVRLHGVLRSDRHARRLQEIRATLEPPGHLPADSTVYRALAEHRARRAERLMTAHKKARQRPSMARLHRYRIRLRQFRHVVQLLGDADPADRALLAESSRWFQRHLGRLHDLDVVISKVPVDFRHTRWAEALRTERRRLKRRVIDRLDRARPPRRGRRATAP